MNGKQLVALIGAISFAVAWISFAEHPTAKNLRSALLSTLSELG
jgi:hypothetical protein